jgi:hypothetical protein
MTIAFRSAGTVSSVTGSATSVTPGLPGSLATGDGVLIFIVTKPETAAPQTPTDWTLVADVAGGGGNQGNGTGPTRTTVFFREKTAAWSTMPAVAVTNGNSSAGYAIAYSKSGTAAWGVAAATGTYGVGATTTNGSSTLGSNPGITAGDWCVVGYSNQDDAPTWSAQGVTATGISAWGTVTERTEILEATTGNDVGGMVFDVPVTTGTASAAPVTAATASVATRGTVALIRLREEALTNENITFNENAGTVDTGQSTGKSAERNENSGTTDANQQIKQVGVATDIWGVSDSVSHNLVSGGDQAQTITDTAQYTDSGQTASIYDYVAIGDDNSGLVDNLSSTITQDTTPVNGSETNSLAIAESVDTLVSIETIDSGALGVSETQTSDIEVLTTESNSLSISDSSDSQLSSSTSDSGSIAVDEDTSSFREIEASDSSAVGISEAMSFTSEEPQNSSRIFLNQKATRLLFLKRQIYSLI